MSIVIRMGATGAPSVLQSATAAVGKPGPGEVRLRQQAIGVNYVDTMVRDGRYPMPLPAVPGFEGAGIVEEAGPGVGLRAGERVGYYFAAGAYAGTRLVPADALVRLPDDISTERAAAFLAKGLTAWMGLRALYALRPGQTVLVQGASGGVGAILSRWAKPLGATVIGVAGSAGRLDKVKAGAHHALHAGDPEVLAKLRALAPEGVDVVYDFVGQAVLDLTLAALRDGGALVAIGAVSGPPRIEPGLLAQRGITLHAGGTPQYVTASNAADAAGELFQAMRDGWFDDLPIVAYPLAQAAQAHEDIAGRALDGLPILVPPSAETDDAVRIAETFFGHWSANRIDEALAMLADDVLYDNVPLPKISGRGDVEKFHRGFGIGSDYTLDWKIVHLAGAGNVVLNERIDTIMHRDGGRIVLPVMGTVTVEQGKISVWRDYFDLADFERQLKSIAPAA